MKKQITVLIDTQTRDIEIDFPIPDDGVPQLLQTPAGEAQVEQPPRTLEQRAYLAFWANGTRDRLNDIIQQKDAAGVHQTLKWLIGMRIVEAYQRTGVHYTLRFVSDRAKWQAHKALSQMEKTG